jgi:hypothetical protein
MFAALGGAFLSAFGFLGAAGVRALQQPNMEPGLFKIFDIAACAEAGNCFYQNSLSPYGRSLFTPTPEVMGADALAGAFILSPNQAVVWIGQTPPSEYWSFIPYLWRRRIVDVGTSGTGSYGNVIFASLTQGINNFEYPNAKQLAVVITRNQNVFDRERRRIQTKFPNLLVVPLWIPLQAPLDSQVIYFMRVAFFPPGTLETYLANPQALTYKVTYTDIGYSPVLAIPANSTFQNTARSFGIEPPAGTLELFLKPLPTEPSEFCYQNLFTVYINQIISKYRILREIEIVDFAGAIDLGSAYSSGLQCVLNNVLCQGDNPTASYSASVSFELAANESILVVAMNHRLTQRCFYTSLNLYQEANALGILSTFPEDTELFYNQIWSPGTGDYRVVERAYVQLPENVAPDNSTMLNLKVFIIPKTTPTPDHEFVFSPLNVNIPGLQILADYKKTHCS